MVLNASWQVRDTNLKPGRIQVCASSLHGSQLEQAMDQMEWFHTSADEQVLSRWRAVVMVWWAAVGFGCSALSHCWLFVFLRTVAWIIFRLGLFACSPTGALLHRWLSSNLSTTTEGATVKLRWASLALCTLNLNQYWDSKIALARSPRTILGFGEKRRGFRV